MSAFICGTLDSNLSFQEADGHLSLKHILEVNERASWMKVFDMDLDHMEVKAQVVLVRPIIWE